MSRRQLKTDDEAGFLLAVHDDLAETRQLFHVQIEMLLIPASTRGHFHITCYAYAVPRKVGDQPIASSATPYPSAHAMRLHAALYRAAIRIGGECARLAPESRVKDRPAP
jgi:hypothetical protein